ncbi:MAG: F0F1 ATP synthase subunit A, partial [Deltaproteobacteria bacterium]|nr:F0F1 ATP synthase subunit A [Deltaproteobacteria bacterium]
MELSPDSTIFWQWGPISLNATIVFTWVVMAVLVVGSWLITRRLSPDGKISRRQNLLETLVTFMNDQIR